MRLSKKVAGSIDIFTTQIPFGKSNENELARPLSHGLIYWELAILVVECKLEQSDWKPNLKGCSIH